MTRLTCGKMAVSCSAAAVLFGAMRLSAASGGAAAVPPMVPPGITLVEVVRELSTSSAQVLWERPGDSNGRTLLISDNDQPGVAKCVDECSREFPPLLAPSGARAFGDWSLVKRPDDGMQWAYQSHPLYTWIKEQEPGEVATNVGLTETANLKLAENPLKAGSLLPPAGWQVSRFDPAKECVIPAGIEVGIVPSAQGVVLTDFKGRTLYTFDGDVKRDGQTCSDSGCEIPWQPVVAPALAIPVGDFSVATRVDGSRQWAYKQQPLYRFSGDLLPGDVHGVGVDKKWKVALLMEAFRPPDVSLTWLDGYGATLSVKGITLYTGSAFQKYWGGRNLRDSFKIAYFKGKRLGPNGCLDAECLKDWRPFLAPGGAQSNGFWEPIARPDGTKQWAYKGYALYTYAGDTAPGHHFGQATYAFAKLEGTPEEMKRAETLEQITKVGGGAGVYWNIAKP